MGKGKIKFLVFLVVILGLFGVLFVVLATEEEKRLVKAAQNRQAFLEEQQAIVESRQKYFESIEAKRAELRSEMDAAKQNYEQQIADQPAAIAGQQTTKTTTVTVPVKTPVTTKVATPKPARKTKTS